MKNDKVDPVSLFIWLAAITWTIAVWVGAVYLLVRITK